MNADMHLLLMALVPERGQLLSRFLPQRLQLLSAALLRRLRAVQPLLQLFDEQLLRMQGSFPVQLPPVLLPFLRAACACLSNFPLLQVKSRAAHRSKSVWPCCCPCSLVGWMD